MPWTADGRWEPEDDSVATRLTGLLASDSPYITQARTAGARTSQKRGLLNSSIASGAAESAAISAAAPIASQDASQTFQRNQALLQGNINLDTQQTLARDQFGYSQQLNQQQADNQLAYGEAQSGWQQELQAMSDAAALERQQLQESGATARQLADFDQRTQEQIRGFEQQSAMQREQLSSNERTALLSSDTSLRTAQIGAASQLSSQYLSAFSNLAANPDIPASVRNTYMREFQRVLNEGQALIGVMEGVQLNWGGGGSTPTPGIETAGTPRGSVTDPVRAAVEATR